MYCCSAVQYISKVRNGENIKMSVKFCTYFNALSVDGSINDERCLA
jgi:hypothetical protein